MPMDLRVSNTAKVSIAAPSDATSFQLFVDDQPIETKAASDVVDGRISFDYETEIGSEHDFRIDAIASSDTKHVTIT